MKKIAIYNLSNVEYRHFIFVVFIVLKFFYIIQQKFNYY